MPNTHWLNQYKPNNYQHLENSIVENLKHIKNGLVISKNSLQSLPQNSSKVGLHSSTMERDL